MTNLNSALESKLEAWDHIDTVIVAFPDLYGRLVGKRFTANFFRDAVAAHGTHACDYLLTVDMEMEPVDGYAFANWNRGYGDFHLVPDTRTFRLATWLPDTAIVICDVHLENHDLVNVAPRSMLRAQIERAADRGLSAKTGSEAEYYSYEQSYRQLARKGYDRARPASDYIEDYHVLQATREEPLHRAIRNHLEASGVPVECTKGEWGLGQHELNLRYAEVLEMADRHTIYKQCAKEIADSMGKSITFMAKPFADGAGSSCHVHLSLWNGDQNAFVGDTPFGPFQCSDQFRWFLGGWIKHAGDLMVMMAPNVNSYKRYQSGSWAPTRLAWAVDNRTAGFRIVGSGPSLRIECRIPGADCNPYLTYAAALAAGLDGIENQIEPPAMFEGNAYDAESVPQVPGTLSEAIARFEASDFAKQAFGQDVVDHYVHFFRTEQAAFDKAVTDWERTKILRTNMNPRYPIIGITTYAANEDGSVTLPDNYINAVRRASGIPVLIAPGESQVKQLLDRLDGIVLAGGGDICPSCYGGESHETVYMVDRERDIMELQLVEHLVKGNTPTLAICRGTQVLNVQLGGTLHAHLPDVVGEAILHRAPPREPILHDVSVESDSRIAAIMQSTKVQTMSWHHQAIDKLGHHLKVIARAPDGVIEGIELTAHPWFVGVQWHPEITAHEDVTQQRLFDALVTASMARLT